MDEERENSKKRVSFGKARVRLIHDYYKQNSAENEDNDEIKSREAPESKRSPFQLQKQPKSILKSSAKSVSVDSGLNALHRRPKRTFECEEMDRNFWIPSKDENEEKKRQDSQESRDTNTKNDLFKTHDVGKEKDNTEVMASNDVESEKDEEEKPVVKNNAKWEGITAGKSLELTSQMFMGIYSGVEADWDQTKQLLSRITGVDVDESRLQKPREFVAVMNMFLSMQKEKSGSQGNRGTKQDDTAVHTATEMPHTIAESNVLTQKDGFRDSNNNDVRLKSKNDLNNEDPVIKEELTSGKLNTTEKSENAGELKKRTKKLRMKGLIPAKKKNISSEIRKERSYSENNLEFFSRCDGKANDDKRISFDKFKKDMSNSDFCSNTLERKKNWKSKQSTSEDNLDYVSKHKVETTSLERDSDTESDCSDPSFTTYDNSDTHVYSDTNSTLPRKTWIDGSLNRDRSSSCPISTDGPVRKDSKYTRRKVVKRDSWFLTRKQKMKKESPHIVEESILKEQEGNDLERGHNPDKPFGEITETTSHSNENSEKKGRDVGKKCSDSKFHNQKTIRISKSNSKFANPKTIGISKSDSKFENKSKNSKQDESSENLEKISILKNLETRSGESGQNSESELMINQTKHPQQVLGDSKSCLENKEKSTAKQTKSQSDLKLEKFNIDEQQSRMEIDTQVSDLKERNEILKLKDNTENDVETSKDRPTLLTIANQLAAERDDSKLSTCPSVGAMNKSANSNRTRTRPVFSEVKESHECQKLNDLPDDTKQTLCTQIQETTPVNVESSPTLAVNNERLDVVTKSQRAEKCTQPNQGDFNDQNSDDDEFLANQKFQNDIRFIDAEAKRSRRSEEYLEKARKRCLTEPKSCHKPTLVLKGMAAFSSNLAGAVLMLPVHLSN